jgi:DNA replication and repair protein RecF
MRVVSVSLRDFRGYRSAAAEIGPGLTVVSGPNGAGKTNLLEALYYGCTGRSCRTNNEREVVRFGQSATRVVIAADGPDGGHELAVGFAPGDAKVLSVDGASVERLIDSLQRPLVSVFLPDRLELVKGVPALRRAHLDQFITALWPARTQTRRGFNHALAQRNALVARLHKGAGSRDSLGAWDAQLARAGIALMADRRDAVGLVTEPFAEICAALELDGDPTIAYRPRSKATTAEELTQELQERRDADVERGFTTHGPHRDDLSIRREGRELRTYGSQGQQRLGLLALLLAEREVIGRLRPARPLILLDDVMSELDGDRRAALVHLLRDGGGQAVITTTDVEHVPGAGEADVSRLEVAAGEILDRALAA